MKKKKAFKYKIELIEREIKIKKFYERKLKRKAFDLLRENYLEAQRIKLNYLRADKFYNYWTKKCVYSVWADKFEDKTDIKSMHLMYKAKKYHLNILTKKCFSNWKIFNQNQHVLSVNISNFYLNIKVLNIPKNL